MAAMVGVPDAEMQLAELISRALAGEGIVIDTGDGQRVRLEALYRQRAREPGRCKGEVAVDDRILEPLPRRGYGAWVSDRTPSGPSATRSAERSAGPDQIRGAFSYGDRRRMGVCRHDTRHD